MHCVLLASQEGINQIMRDSANGTFYSTFTSAFSSVFNFIQDYVLGWFNSALYEVWNGLLRIIWLLEQVFDIFTGTTGVYVRDSGGQYRGGTTLIDAVFFGSKVQNAFAAITGIAFALCFLFTIFAVIRSMGDSIGELKRPVSAVMRSALKAALTFLLISMGCIAVIKASTAITTVVVGAANQPDCRICDCIFVTTVNDNFKTEEAAQKAMSGRYFMTQEAKDNVNYTRVNYTLGIISAFFMIVVLVTLATQAIFRIMVVTTLFIVSPFFVSTIPLDDGEKFKDWTRLFVAFALSTFGPMFVMRIYSSIMPMLGPGGQINFAEDFNSISAVIFRMLFILGGAYAAWQSQYVIIEIIDPAAVSLLKRSQFMMAIAKSAAKSAVDYASAGATKAMGALKGAMGGASGGSDEK